MSEPRAERYAYESPTFGTAWTRPKDTAKRAPLRHRLHIKRWIRRIILLVVAAVIAVGGFLGWELYRNAAKLTGDKNPLTLLSTLRPSPLTESNGRVNILLAGYSADDPGHQGADLTDSIMIVSIDPSTKTATLISVPRDLYVNIPGFGYSKINAAYEDGQGENFSQAGYPNGGMGLLEKTVGQDFGVQFNYYALLNYAAFKDAVNAVGGITVDIQSPDPRGLYDPNTNLKLPNGEVALDGQEALNLARARGDGPGSYGFPDADFNRTQHQQQMLVALKDKAGSASVISNPLKVAGLANAVGNNLITDMTIGQMETLYSDSKGITNTHITSVTINNYQGTDLVTDYITPDGEDALIPAAGMGNYNAIQSAVANLLGS